MFIDKLTNGIQDAINNKYGKIFVIEENVIFHKHFITNIKNLEFPTDSRIISLGTNDFKGEPNGFYRITPDTKQDLFAVLIDRSVFKEIYNTGNIESIIHTRAPKLLLLLTKFGEMLNIAFMFILQQLVFPV